MCPEKGIISLQTKKASRLNGGAFLFLTTVLVALFLTDLIKIFLAKKVKSNLTPRFIIKTKKWVSILIIGFGVLLLLQGIFPDKLQEGMEHIPGTTEIIE